MNQRVLVTGGAGYIGSVLVRQLLAKGYEVRVLDNLKFGGASLRPLAGHSGFEMFEGDIRDAKMVEQALKRVSSVVHLAAIVGDPASTEFPEETKEVNWEGSKLLWEQSLAAGVNRFVFASTCSNYGLMKGAVSLLDEDAPLKPQSLYAKTKVKFEKFLLDQTKTPVSRTILRFATVYGYSPRMRFDLTVNHFCRDLFHDRKLEVFGENQWRPYCHVQDLAASVVAVLGQPRAQMDGMVFNVGDSRENYTKQQIVDLIQKQVTTGKIIYPKKKSDDKRNYRVDFSRARMALGFRISRDMESGIDEILRSLNSGLLPDPFDKIYSNT